MRASSDGSFEGLQAERPYPGVERRSFDSREATVTRYAFEPGASFPLHRHPQEQVTLIERGTVELIVGGSLRRLREGDWSVVAPDVEHGIRAGAEGARVLAIVVPRRSRSDAYQVIGERS